MREITITTPEHVEVRLEPAGAGSRFLAITIDSLVTYGTPILFFQLIVPFLSFAFAFALAITFSFALHLGWHVYFETRRGGLTPGKRLLCLRLATGEDLPYSLLQS